MIVNMCVGFLTPPFAVGIFVSTKIADSTFGETVKEAIPFILVGPVSYTHLEDTGRILWPAAFLPVYGDPRHDCLCL